STSATPTSKAPPSAARSAPTSPPTTSNPPDDGPVPSARWDEGTGSLAHVQIPSGRAILGGVIVLAIAAGFELELAWLFILGAVLFMAWAGFVLVHPGDS